MKTDGDLLRDILELLTLGFASSAGPLHCVSGSLMHSVTSKSDTVGSHYGNGARPSRSFADRMPASVNRLSRMRTGPAKMARFPLVTWFGLGALSARPRLISRISIPTGHRTARFLVRVHVGYTRTYLFQISTDELSTRQLHSPSSFIVFSIFRGFNSTSALAADCKWIPLHSVGAFRWLATALTTLICVKFLTTALDSLTSNAGSNSISMTNSARWRVNYCQWYYLIV